MMSNTKEHFHSINDTSLMITKYSKSHGFCDAESSWTGYSIERFIENIFDINDIYYLPTKIHIAFGAHEKDMYQLEKNYIYSKLSKTKYLYVPKQL